MVLVFRQYLVTLVILMLFTSIGTQSVCVGAMLPSNIPASCKSLSPRIDSERDVSFTNLNRPC